MDILKKLKTQKDISTTERDSVAKGPLESGVYDAVIEMVYLDESSGGALNANFTFVTDSGKKVRNTQYITSGNAKGKRNYYERNGKKFYLPGFELVNGICLLTAGKDLSQMTVEERTIKLYDFDEGKEVPKNKNVIMDLLGQKITLGILKVLEDKKKKNSNGEWVPSGDDKVVNEIDKIFRAADGKTIIEIKAQTDAAYKEQWAKVNTGTVVDNRSEDTKKPSPVAENENIFETHEVPPVKETTPSLFGTSEEEDNAPFK